MINLDHKGMDNLAPKQNRLKLTADKACAAKLQKTKQEAEQQVDAFYQAMTPIAAKGLYEATYDGHLEVMPDLRVQPTTLDLSQVHTPPPIVSCIVS